MSTCMYNNIHDYVFIQILMSVVMEPPIALKHVQTLMEASLVDVIMAMY